MPKVVELDFSTDTSGHKRQKPSGGNGNGDGEAPSTKDSFVLIRCSQPSASGDMEVTLTYQGEIDLLSLITKQAGDFFESSATQFNSDR